MYARVIIAFAVGSFAGMVQAPPTAPVQEPVPVVEAAPALPALVASQSVPTSTPPSYQPKASTTATSTPAAKTPEPAGKAAVDALIAQYAADLTRAQRAKLSSFALCESGYTQLNDDGSPYMSGYGTPDCGVFQINKVHWDAPVPAHNAVCTSLDENVKVAVQLFRESGAQPWENSRACWAKPVPGW